MCSALHGYTAGRLVCIRERAALEPMVITALSHAPAAECIVSRVSRRHVAGSGGALRAVPDIPDNIVGQVESTLCVPSVNLAPDAYVNARHIVRNLKDACVEFLCRSYASLRRPGVRSTIAFAIFDSS